MKRAVGLVGLLVTLGVVYFIVKTQLVNTGSGAAPPEQVIDVVGVKNEMLAVGQAEQMYMASHGVYASLNQLHKSDAVTFSGSDFRGYQFSIATNDGQGFTLTATPEATATAGGPTFTMDQTMQINTQ